MIGSAVDEAQSLEPRATLMWRRRDATHDRAQPSPAVGAMSSSFFTIVADFFSAPR